MARTRRGAAPIIDYKEPQVAHLCANHAFNHVLQENKMVWVPNKPFLLTNDLKAAPASASPKDEAIKLNTWAFCKDHGLAHLRAQRAEYLHEDADRIFRQLAAGEPTLKNDYYKNPKYTADLPRDLAFWKENQKKYGGKSIEQIVAILDKAYGKDESLQQLEHGGIGCTMNGMSRGDLPFTWFRDLFELLGYTYLEVDDTNFKAGLRTNMDKAGYLGAVINQGKWHYVSVPKHIGLVDCPRHKYVLADSLDKQNIFACHSKRELYTALAALPLTRAFLLFAKDGDAYQSVAVKRMLKKMGRKKYTRKMG